MQIWMRSPTENEKPYEVLVNCKSIGFFKTEDEARKAIAEHQALSAIPANPMCWMAPITGITRVKN